MARQNKSFIKQQQLNAYKAQFAHTFTISEVYVDIEEMGANYADELVPLVDIARGVAIVIQDKIASPKGNKYASYAISNRLGELVHKDKIFTHWMFQRNTYNKNVTNIFNNWFEPCARSGKGVRLPEQYGGIVLAADSSHTSVTRIIRGDNYLPFEISEIPDQGSYRATLKLAIEVAGEIFLSLNNKTVKRPNKFDIYRIAVVQQQEPEFSIHNVISPLGFKVKQESAAPMTIHNLQDIHFLWNLDKTGVVLDKALAWWKRNWAGDTVDPCLGASFGYLMHLEQGRLKRPWTIKEEDQLAKIIQQRWNIIEFADDFIKHAYSEVTLGQGYHDSNNQVMYGLAYIWNNATNAGITIPSGLDFSKAKKYVL